MRGMEDPLSIISSNGKLGKEERKMRKKARKSLDSMLRHEGRHMDIIDGMIATDGIRTSKISQD